MISDNYIIEDNSRYFYNRKTQNLALDVMTSPYPIIQGEGETAFVFYFKLVLGNAKNWFDDDGNYNSTYYQIKEDGEPVGEWAFPGISETIDIQIQTIHIALDINNKKECSTSDMEISNNNFYFMKTEGHELGGYQSGKWSYHTIDSTCFYKDQPNVISYQINYSDKFLDKTSGKIIINDLYNSHRENGTIIGIESYSNIFDDRLQHPDEEHKKNSLFQASRPVFYAEFDFSNNGVIENNYITDITDFNVVLRWMEDAGRFADIEKFWNFTDKIRANLIQEISNLKLSNVQITSLTNPLDFKNIDAHIEYDAIESVGRIVIDTKTEYNNITDNLEISGNIKGIDLPITNYSLFEFKFDIDDIVENYYVDVDNNDYFNIDNILITDQDERENLKLTDTWYLRQDIMFNYFNINFDLDQYLKFLGDVSSEK